MRILLYFCCSLVLTSSTLVQTGALAASSPPRYLQDVGYAQFLEDRGETEQAEQMLQGLAEDGYLEASLALAELYLDSEQPEKLRQAGEYFQVAMQSNVPGSDYRYLQWQIRMSQVDTSYRRQTYEALTRRQQNQHDALPLLAQFLSFHSAHYPPAELRAVLDQLQQDPAYDRLSFAQTLNRLERPSDYSDYLAATCREKGNSELQDTCIQLQLKLAQQQDDLEHIDQLIEQLHQGYEDHKGHYQQSNLLYKCASILLKDIYGPQKLLAALRIAEFGSAEDDRLFLLRARYEYKRNYSMTTDELYSGLDRLEQSGSAEAAFFLGRMYAEGLRVTPDPSKGEQYLLKIRENPKAALCLGRLYLTGILGSEKLQDGVDLLVYAARGGKTEAYLDLARSFSMTAGIMPNPIYSWVFANMALQITPTDDSEKVAKIKELLSEQAHLIQDQSSADSLLAKERKSLNWNL